MTCAIQGCNFPEGECLGLCLTRSATPGNPQHDLDMARFMAGARRTQVGGTHYKDMKIEPWDVIDTWPVEQRIGAYRAGALKYILRMGSKDESAQEIRKAGHYCQKLAETLEAAK